MADQTERNWGILALHLNTMTRKLLTKPKLISATVGNTSNPNSHPQLHLPAVSLQPTDSMTGDNWGKKQPLKKTEIQTNKKNKQSSPNLCLLLSEARREVLTLNKNDWSMLGPALPNAFHQQWKKQCRRVIKTTWLELKTCCEWQFITHSNKVTTNSFSLWKPYKLPFGTGTKQCRDWEEERLNIFMPVTKDNAATFLNIIHELMTIYMKKKKKT